MSKLLIVSNSTVWKNVTLLLEYWILEYIDKGIFGKEVKAHEQIKPIKADGTHGTVGLVETDGVLKWR